MNLVKLSGFLKNEYKNSCILIKSGIFYQSFNDDAILLNYIFKYKLNSINNTQFKIGFPISNINDVIRILNNEKVNYVIYDNKMNIVTKKFKNNMYNNMLIISKENLSNEIKIEQIIVRLKEKMIDDNLILDKILSNL